MCIAIFDELENMGQIKNVLVGLLERGDYNPAIS